VLISCVQLLDKHTFDQQLMNEQFPEEKNIREYFEKK